jgi:DNA adenine methylase
MKTPISYYGGKQSMIKDILPLIPEHNTYVEPFCGGAAIFFAKPISKIEVINDLNGNVANFYEVMKTDFDKLKRLVSVTIHSCKTYSDATLIYKNPHLFSKVRRAWAFWICCNMSYGSSPGGGWAFQKRDKNRCSLKLINAAISFSETFNERIKHVSVECNDAIKVITRFDCEDTFHYIDPPYYNANMGHYAGYTEENFKELLTVLSKDIKGKFLLSSYNSEVLKEYVAANGWVQKFIDKPLSMSKGKRKVEVLTANYPI